MSESVGRQNDTISVLIAPEDVARMRLNAMLGGIYVAY